MRKTFAIAWIFSIMLLILPHSSFGVDAIVSNYEGDIEGLEFDFGPGLPISLPGMDSFVAMYATVEAAGREGMVITSSGRYNYHAKLGEGTIYVDTSKGKKGVIAIPMASATLDEHFAIEGPIPEDPLDVVVPDDVSLYFKATLITAEGSFNFALKLLHGQVQFIRP